MAPDLREEVASLLRILQKNQNITERLTNIAEQQKLRLDQLEQRVKYLESKSPSHG